MIMNQAEESGELSSAIFAFSQEKCDFSIGILQERCFGGMQGNIRGIGTTLLYANFPNYQKNLLFPLQFLKIL